MGDKISLQTEEYEILGELIGRTRIILLDLTFNQLKKFSLDWVDFCLFDCSLQSIDLRGNDIAEIHYSGDQIVIPILLRISKNPLSLSYSLSKIRQVFLVDTENIQISDGVGQIPIREVSKYLDGHIDSVDIPLCLVMSSFFLCICGSLIFFIKVNDYDWRKHNLYLQKLAVTKVDTLDKSLRNLNLPTKNLNRGFSDSASLCTLSEKTSRSNCDSNNCSNVRTIDKRRLAYRESRQARHVVSSSRSQNQSCCDSNYTSSFCKSSS